MPALIASEQSRAGGVLGGALIVLAAVFAPANAYGTVQIAEAGSAMTCPVEPATAAVPSVAPTGVQAYAPATASSVVPSPAPRASLPADFLATEDPVYSQFREEIYIRHFFNDERSGVYLDVGAWYPKRNSTTAYLELELGWTGIAVDPCPGLHDLWKRSRPRAKFFSYFAGNRSGVRLPFYLGYGVSSYSEEHVRLLSKMGEKRPERVDVEMITLNDLLEREGVESIDFMSIDIEGGEPKALAGFDIDRYKPRLVCIEAGRPKSDRRIRIAAYFDAHGYRRITEYEAPYADPNWYLTPRSAAERGRARAARPRGALRASPRPSGTVRP